MRTGLYINEPEITRFFHTRGCFFFVAMLSIVATLAAYFSGTLPPLPTDMGLYFNPPRDWLDGVPVLSLIFNILANFIIGYAVVVITKQFNTIRSLSRVVATLFIVMQTATPTLMCEFYSGTFIAMVMVLETALLFTTYDNKYAVRRVFLIFFIATTGGLFCTPLLLYIPFLPFGLAQMRIFRFRSIMAALIGIITPFWILLGFGIITFDHLLYLPDISPIFTNAPKVPVQLLTAAVLTAVLGVMFLIGNLMKLIAYNAQIRAFNGVFILLMFSSIILMLLNSNAIAAYMPTLNIAVAYQIAHFFAERRHRRSYIAILSTFVPYILLYLWSLQ